MQRTERGGGGGGGAFTEARTHTHTHTYTHIIWHDQSSLLYAGGYNMGGYLGSEGNTNNGSELVHALLHLLQCLAVLVEMEVLGSMGRDRSPVKR